MPDPAEMSAGAPPGAARGASWGRQVPALLAFVAGFVDVQCYLGLHGTFAAFMTGNLIALGAELADPTPNAALKAVMIASFVPSVAITSVRLRALRRRHDDEAVVRGFVLAEVLLVAALMLLGGLLQPLPAAWSWQTVVLGIVAVAAMSVQNVLMVHLLAFHPATTVMTLNMIHLIGHSLGGVVPRAAAPAGAEASPRPNASEARRYAAAIVPFLLGVAIGGFGHRWLGFWSLASPVAALVLLGASLFRRRGGLRRDPESW